MASFFDNLRNSALLAKRQNSQSWDSEAIGEALEERWGGLDKTENPYVSFNVNIPETQQVRNIQSGKYKLDNDTNKTGINNDNALYIVGNTYQTNNDGTYYGMGWDGRPYSYKIKNNTVGDFTPLGIDEQKKAIDRISNGKVSIHETITNPATLASIYRSIERMKNNGNGNLINDYVLIGDSDPDSVEIMGGNGIMGVARNSGYGTKERPDHIDLLGSNFPSVQSWKSDMSYNAGWHPVGGLDSTPQHELAHTAEYALTDAGRRYYNKITEDAKKYKGKYPADLLWLDAIDKIKYAIPVLSDKVFGTHLVPSKEEAYNMSESENSSISDLGNYWVNYYTPLEDKFPSSTVEERMINEADKKVDKWYDAISEKYGNGERYLQAGLFDKAAKNLGYKSVNEAIGTISEYAKNNYSEAFAEAYSDVLINGSKAKPFSKELIKLYTEAADYTAKTFGKEKPEQLKLLQDLTSILPKDAINNPKEQLNRFQNNYRTFYKNR